MLSDKLKHSSGIYSPSAEDLTERQREILRLIIQHYVLTANPIGSRYLARISGLGLSDASTRNIMADLEYMGFIDHPHTSAGRMPTDKGYRVYVDYLMSRQHISDEERTAISRTLLEAVSAEDVIAESSAILAKLSKQLSLILLPSLEEGILEHVDIMQLSSNRILIVLAASSGRVRTVTMETESKISQSKIDELRMQLNSRLSGRTFKEIKATFHDRISDLEDHEKSILRVFLDSPEKLFEDTGAERVKISGAKHIFSQPEFQKKNIFPQDEFESIIELIEDEEVVIHVLERSAESLRPNGTSEVSIRIGSEIENEKMSNYSVICTKYQVAGHKGMIGLIGPKRMDYGRMTPLVEFVASAMTGMLSGK